MKPEKPLRVIPNKNRKHKTETRIFAREIHESFCAQPGCRFHGKPSVQGVCHSTERFDGERDIIRWFMLKAKQHAKDRTYFHKLFAGKPERYIAHLEAHYESAMMNWSLGIEELVKLRRENAILRDKLERHR